MDSRHDPVVDAARKLALFLAAFDVGLGVVAMRRPRLLNTLFGFPVGAESFYRRWGVQILGYTAVQLLAVAFPSPGTFTAVASLRGVEVAADANGGRGVEDLRRFAHPFASAFNAASTALFLTAARRMRHREALTDVRA